MLFVVDIFHVQYHSKNKKLLFSGPETVAAPALLVSKLRYVNAHPRLS